jgi:hypothetical protein
MQFFGVIRRKPGRPPINFDDWRGLLNRRPELFLPKPREVQGRNPLTGEPIIIRARPDGAIVKVGEQVVGHVGLSQAGDDEVIVSGDPVHIIPLARELAAELDAEFMELPNDETNNQAE